MKNINEYSIAYAEILEILKYIPKEEYNKIPEEKIKLFRSNADKEYICNYNPEKTLEENNISKRAKAIIAILFRDYWASDTQRKKIVAKQNNDRRTIEEEKIKNYNYKDMFKNNNINNKESQTENITASNNKIIEYKEKWFRKVFNKINKLFKK